METVKLVQALCALVFLLAPLASSTSNSSALQETCKSFTTCDWHPAYDYCLKFFQADKGSVTADKHGLAVIAVNIIDVSVKSMVKRIDALKASEKNEIRQVCLGACTELYSDAVDASSEAIKSITTGTSKGLKDALTALDVVLYAPDTCEEGFNESGVSSPLEVEDRDFEDEVEIAICVLSALVPSL